MASGMNLMKEQPADQESAEHKEQIDPGPSDRLKGSGQRPPKAGAGALADNHLVVKEHQHNCNAAQHIELDQPALLENDISFL